MTRYYSNVFEEKCNSYEEALKAIISRSENDKLGTAKVIDMREMAYRALGDINVEEIQKPLAIWYPIETIPEGYKDHFLKLGNGPIMMAALDYSGKLYIIDGTDLDMRNWTHWCPLPEGV